jgi:hypothetical protein
MPTVDISIDENVTVNPNNYLEPKITNNWISAVILIVVILFIIYLLKK